MRLCQRGCGRPVFGLTRKALLCRECREESTRASYRGPKRDISAAEIERRFQAAKQAIYKRRRGAA